MKEKMRAIISIIFIVVFAGSMAYINYTKKQHRDLVLKQHDIYFDTVQQIWLLKIPAVLNGDNIALDSLDVRAEHYSRISDSLLNSL